MDLHHAVIMKIVVSSFFWVQLRAMRCNSLCLIIKKYQTKDSYTSSFQIVQDIVKGEIRANFYHQNYGSIHMTDNCSAEIEAALIVCPSSVFLLMIAYITLIYQTLIGYYCNSIQNLQFSIIMLNVGIMWSQFSTEIFRLSISIMVCRNLNSDINILNLALLFFP